MFCKERYRREEVLKEVMGRGDESQKGMRERLGGGRGM